MKYIFRFGNPLTAAIIIVMGLISMPENLVLGQISVKNVNSVIVDNENIKWFDRLDALRSGRH